MADVDEIGVTEALALHQQGRLAEAEPIYRRVLSDDAKNAQALSLLGTLCLQTKRNEEAVVLLEQAVALKDDEAGWFANLGLVLRTLERYTEGAAALRRALELRPDYPEALSNLGLVLHQMSDFEGAIAAFKRAIALKPEMAGFHVNLGATYLQIEQFDAAEAAFRQARTLNPRHLAANTNLGMTLVKSGQLEAAEGVLRDTLKLDPKSAETYRALGESLREQGRMVEAIGAFETSVELSPDSQSGYQSLLFTRNYISAGTPAEALLAARHFDALIMQPAPDPHQNPPDPDRRIKVGFVSGDFRRHPVGQFVGHLLPIFDRSRFEITLYANQVASDENTVAMKASADHWRDIKRLKDEAVEALIREDGIDILVDLSGHTGGNRLPLFARRPAPVQMTWLGYSGTTGLSSIDYIICDASVVPEADTAHYSETPLRLPASYLCYAPPKLSGLTLEVAPTPALANGSVTFGTFNNLYKMSDQTVSCWAAVLKSVPSSRLLLKTAVLKTEEGRRAVERRFAQHGIDAERLILKPSIGSHLLHFQSYGEIDIGLDPFPYNGTTTTCDSLWMGVPVVTLDGDRFISRVGASLMRTVGLGELVAQSEDEVVAIAQRLANDLPRLTEIRRNLRGTLLASPLGDPTDFTRQFEAALRQAWQTWCDGPAARSTR
jgi:protein O-GlcNAc transferase